MRLGGPELKMPDLSGLRSKLPGGSGAGKGSGLKLPDPLLDVYYDLRDRRLLPLVALVLVAIVATPILLSQSSEAPEVPAGAGLAETLGGEAGKTSSLTVVEATPGLRDYRKRLHGTPVDPFVQKYTGVPGTSKLKSTGAGESGGSSGEGSSGGGGGSELSGGGSAGGESSGDGSSGGGGKTGGDSGGSGGSGGKGGSGDGKPPQPQDSNGVRIFEYVFDLQIAHTEATADGGRKMGEPEVRHRVKTLTQLPSKKVVVATVGGVNLHTGKVYFLVADEVHSLDGDFRCVTRAPGELCELLEIEPGFPLELTYGPNRIRYRIKVTGVDAVWSGRPGDGHSKRIGYSQSFTK